MALLGRHGLLPPVLRPVCRVGWPDAWAWCPADPGMSDSGLMTSAVLTEGSGERGVPPSWDLATAATCAARPWDHTVLPEAASTPVLCVHAPSLRAAASWSWWTAARDPHWVSSPLGTVLCSAGVTHVPRPSTGRSQEGQAAGWSEGTRGVPYGRKRRTAASGELGLGVTSARDVGVPGVELGPRAPWRGAL